MINEQHSELLSPGSVSPMKNVDKLKEIEPMMDWESLSLMLKKPHRNDIVYDNDSIIYT